MRELTGLPIDWETFTFTEMSDAGLALHFGRELKQDLIYEADAREWLYWDEGNWAADEGQIRSRLDGWLRHFGKTLEPLASREPGVTAPKLQQLGATKNIDDTIKALSTSIDLRKRADQLDASPYELNVVGGVVDLETLEECQQVQRTSSGARPRSSGYPGHPGFASSAS